MQPDFFLLQTLIMVVRTPIWLEMLVKRIVHLLILQSSSATQNRG
jgi:hypothetical protein